MPIKLSVENITSDLYPVFKHGRLRNVLNVLQYEHDRFIKYHENVAKLQKLLLVKFNEDIILNNNADKSKLECIIKQFNSLNFQHEILIYTLKKFSISLKEFINNPCLETAINLKDSYEMYSHNIAELNKYDYSNDNQFATNFATNIELLKKSIKSSALTNDILKFFQKNLNELIKKYKYLKDFETIGFKTVDFGQWYANIKLLANQSFKKLLLQTDYTNNLVGYLRQSNNPIIGNGLCSGIALYGVYKSLTTKDIKVEGDLLVANDKISYVEQCHCFKKKSDLITLLPSTKLTGQSPKQASKFIAEKLKNILIKVGQNEYGFKLHMGKNNKKASSHAFGISKTKDHIFFIDANYGVFKFNINELERFDNFISWFLYVTRYCYRYNDFTITSMPSIEHEFPTPLNLKLDAIPNLLLTSAPVANKNIPKFKKALRFTTNRITKLINNIRDFGNLCNARTAVLADCYRNRNILR